MHAGEHVTSIPPCLLSLASIGIRHLPLHTALSALHTTLPHQFSARLSTGQVGAFEYTCDENGTLSATSRFGARSYIVDAVTDKELRMRSRYRGAASIATAAVIVLCLLFVGAS